MKKNRTLMLILMFSTMFGMSNSVHLVSGSITTYGSYGPFLENEGFEDANLSHWSSTGGPLVRGYAKWGGDWGLRVYESRGSIESITQYLSSTTDNVISDRTVTLSVWFKSFRDFDRIKLTIGGQKCIQWMDVLCIQYGGFTQTGGWEYGNKGEWQQYVFTTNLPIYSTDHFVKIEMKNDNSYLYGYLDSVKLAVTESRIDTSPHSQLSSAISIFGNVPYYGGDDGDRMLQMSIATLAAIDPDFDHEATIIAMGIEVKILSGNTDNTNLNFLRFSNANNLEEDVTASGTGGGKPDAATSLAIGGTLTATEAIAGVVFGPEVALGLAIVYVLAQTANTYFDGASSSSFENSATSRVKMKWEYCVYQNMNYNCGAEHPALPYKWGEGSTNLNFVYNSAYDYTIRIKTWANTYDVFGDLFSLVNYQYVYLY